MTDSGHSGYSDRTPQRLTGDNQKGANAFVKSILLTDTKALHISQYDLRTVSQWDYEKFVAAVWDSKQFLSHFHRFLEFSGLRVYEDRDDVIYDCRAHFLRVDPRPIYLCAEYIYSGLSSPGRTSRRRFSSIHTERSYELLLESGWQPLVHTDLFHAEWESMRPYFLYKMRCLIYANCGQQRSRQGTWDAYVLVDTAPLDSTGIVIVLDVPYSYVALYLQAPVAKSNRRTFECQCLAMEQKSVEDTAILIERSVDTVIADLAKVRKWHLDELRKYLEEIFV